MNKISPRTKSDGAEHRRISEPVSFMLTLLFASLAVYVGSLTYYSFISSSDYYTGTITVSGHGEVEIKPDVQSISINIAPEVSSDATSTIARLTNEYAMKTVFYLKSKGVYDSDIKMPSPKSITAKLRGTNLKNSKIIEADIEKIAPKSITITLEDPEVENMNLIKSRALEMALNNAKINAIKVSRSLGAELGKVVSYYDNDAGSCGYDCVDDFSDENSSSDVVTSDISVSFQTR